MAAIFDPFTRIQNTNTSLPPASANWTPDGSRAMLGFAGTISNSNVTVLDHWYVLKPVAGTNDPAVSYNYGVPRNLSGVVTLRLIGVTVLQGAATYALRMSDSTTTQTVNSTLVGTTITWTFASFNLLNKAAITTLRIDALSPGATFEATFAELTSQLVCLGSETIITLNINDNKPIKELKRGDYVLGHDYQLHPIAHVVRISFPGEYKIDLVKIPANAIEPDQPNQELLISGWHPILYKGARRPSKTFINYPGVIHSYHTIAAEELLPKNIEGDYSLYNLQFDHEVIFNANGIWVQALSPRSLYVPLHRDLYFNLKYINYPLTRESHITDTPWIDTIQEIDTNPEDQDITELLNTSKIDTIQEIDSNPEDQDIIESLNAPKIDTIQEIDSDPEDQDIY